MARVKGARNADYDLRRLELVRKLRERLGRVGVSRASWRQLADAAGIGLATLAHYFGKREDVVRAVMEDDLRQGQQPLNVLATPSSSFGRSVRDALTHIATGFNFGVGDILSVGLIEGLQHPTLGPAFVELSLEPMLEAASARLAAHQAKGEMIKVNTRFAAVELVSPLILVFLHQRPLGGATNHAMDIDAFIKAHAASFVRSYSAK